MWSWLFWCGDRPPYGGEGTSKGLIICLYAGSTVFFCHTLLQQQDWIFFCFCWIPNVCVLRVCVCVNACVCVCVNACVCVCECMCMNVCVCEGMCVCECDACNDDGVVSVLAALLSATTADGEAGGGHCRLPEEHHPFSRLPHLLCAESLCRYFLSLTPYVCSRCQLVCGPSWQVCSGCMPNDILWLLVINSVFVWWWWCTVLMRCGDDDVVSVQVSADDATLCKILSKAGEIIWNCWLFRKTWTKTTLNTTQDLWICLFNCWFDWLSGSVVCLLGLYWLFCFPLKFAFGDQLL